MNTKCTKWSFNITYAHKIFQMAIKHINSFPVYGLPYIFYPNWDFWFAIKPPGNPGVAV
jgi:hypothetical protein